MNVQQAMQDWTTYRSRMVELGLVAGTTHKNQTEIAIVIAKGLGGHALTDLRKSHIELWMGERLRTCAPVTVRGELNVLRQVLNWCVDEQLMVTKPRLPTLSVENVESALPADAAFLWVLANVPAHHAAALEFMMLTGLSPHELERVQVQDGPDAHAGQLAIGLRPDFAVKQASRRRLVPLNQRALVIWFEAAPGLAPNASPFPTVAAMQKAIVRTRDANDFAKRGLPPLTGANLITPKLMRKWFASKVAGAQPEHVLQRLMGHAPGSPITRRHYVRSSEEQGRDAVASVAL